MEPVSYPVDPRFIVKASTIPGAGRGLFATVDIGQGERLEVLGPRVIAESVEDQCTSYADGYKFRVGEHLIIPLGICGMANHSDNPNILKVIEDNRVYLEMARTILAGEELFLHYAPRARIHFENTNP